MIVVKNSGLFKKETKKKVSGLKELRDNLEKYLEDNIEEIKENLLLIFVEDSVEKLNITKTVEKIGGAICNAYKVNVENGALSKLIETSGTNMQELINEIRKQIEYAGERWNYN